MGSGRSGSARHQIDQLANGPLADHIECSGTFLLIDGVAMTSMWASLEGKQREIWLDPINCFTGTFNNFF